MASPPRTSALLAMLLAFALGCTGSHGTQTQSPGTPATASILVGGLLQPDGANLNEAVYWQNGTPVLLSPGAGGSVNAMAVSGSSIYAVGWSSLYANGATLWVNGVASNLSTPMDTSPGSDTLSGVAVAGTDVYVSGTVDYGDFGATAVFWKNGVATSLGPGATNGICVQGTDVYVLSTGPDYWKNGTLHGLGSTSGASTPRAIAVTAAGDVLVAGVMVQNNIMVATLWTNGVPKPLSDGVTPAAAAGLAVSGNDVYVAGWIWTGEYTSNAVYWKNGVDAALATPSVATGFYQAQAVVVDGGDVYVAGTVNSAPVVWKNGVINYLTAPYAQGYPSCICILNP